MSTEYITLKQEARGATILARYTHSLDLIYNSTIKIMLIISKSIEVMELTTFYILGSSKCDTTRQLVKNEDCAPFYETHEDIIKAMQFKFKYLLKDIKGS